jgi:predicted amidohydrolase YtcJ
MASRLATILVIVIVGATFIAGLIVGAQRDDANGPVDLIIVNGKVYPGGGAKIQEAVAVRGNQILRVGSNRDVKRLRRAQTVVLDAHGATVLPGLNDAHVQLMAGALTLEQLDLSKAATLDDLDGLLGSYAEEMQFRPWLLGRNGSTELFSTAGIAARRILDDASADKPVLLTSEDGKIAWVNSEALKRAGITRRTKALSAGTIVRDRKTGEPTGVLKGRAIDLMTQVLSQPSHAEKIVALRAAIEEAHRLGVTSIQTVNRTSEELDLLKEIREQGDLSLRVYGSLIIPTDISEDGVAALGKLRDAYPDDPLLKLGGVEIACPCEPAKLEHTVALLDKENWHVMVRASDENDVHAALDAFEHAVAANRSSAPEHRFRLEDVETVDTEDIARIPRFSVVTEPADIDASPNVPQLLAALGEAGTRILFGSDWPESSLDPKTVLADALPSSEEPGAAPPQAASNALRAAVDAYTGQAAYASNDEQRKGTLAPGMLADIVILSNDIFQNPPESIKESAVTVTIVDGKVVYQRPAPESSN